jgi:hypothetical protein
VAESRLALGPAARYAAREAGTCGMSSTNTPDEKARMALVVFKHFGLRPKETLRVDNFTSFAPRRGWDPGELMEGLEHGKTLGWFEDGPNESTRLTSAGFAAI